MSRPVLLYDGECGFCRVWAGFWKQLTGEAVAYIPWQQGGDYVQGIREVELRRGVQLIENGGRWSNAEAVFRLLARVPEYAWMFWAYRHVPFFSGLAERLYRFTGSHRGLTERITSVLWGRGLAPPRYEVAAMLLAKFIAVIYLIAFFSLAVQVKGLLGSQGILPVSELIRFVHEQAGTFPASQFPTLFFWSASDSTLAGAAWLGMVLATVAALLPARLPRDLVFATLWVLYLSFVTAGQDFLQFQWDFLLLETGFLAIFLRPVFSRMWLFQWLLFRLMFESGAVKLLSHDPTWRNLTAMSFHYWTQPLPNRIAWYLSWAPLSFHEISTAFVLVSELAIPFLVFGPRHLRYFAGVITIALQLLIVLTGSYTFFNYLAIALCFSLFDDTLFRRIPTPATPVRQSLLQRAVTAGLFLIVFCLGASQLGRMFYAPISFLSNFEQRLAPFGIVNTYGLFAVMTTTRPEIELEGSSDGQTWKAYRFRYKAGPTHRAPVWAGPYQPRLDWQMWFAALGPARASPWFRRFVERLSEASPAVLQLLEYDPFEGKRPTYLRAKIYDYRFASPDENRANGSWWKREFLGNYF